MKLHQSTEIGSFVRIFGCRHLFPSPLPFLNLAEIILFWLGRTYSTYRRKISELDEASVRQLTNPERSTRTPRHLLPGMSSGPEPAKPQNTPSDQTLCVQKHVDYIKNLDSVRQFIPTMALLFMAGKVVDM